MSPAGQSSVLDQVLGSGHGPMFGRRIGFVLGLIVAIAIIGAALGKL